MKVRNTFKTTALMTVLGALLFGCNAPQTRSQANNEFSSNTSLPATPVNYEVPAGAGLDFRAAAKKVLPSVVSVDQYANMTDFFGQETGQIVKSGTGSGVILTADGYIVTNNHVVDRAAEVSVRTNDKHTFKAKVIGKDPVSDLALLKIDTQGLTPIEFGDSSKVEIGQWALAVGNPLGYDGTVSAGVISSLNRSLQDSQTSYLVGAIQTDAPINPGNSGGALVDASGKLIGINTAIASQTGGSVGIGFAIPVNRVRRVAEEIRKFGYAKAVGIGIVPYFSNEGRLYGPETMNLNRPVVRDLVKQQTGAEPPKQGVIIFGTSRGGSAAQANIEAFDVITNIDDQPVEGFIDLRKELADKKVGDQVKITIWHKGQNRTVNLSVVELPQER